MRTKINMNEPSLEEMQMFSNRISEIMKGTDYTHIEAIVEYCNQTGLEVEVAATLINPNMKEKIQKESIASRLIKDTDSRLPI